MVTRASQGWLIRHTRRGSTAWKVHNSLLTPSHNSTRSFGWARMNA